MGDSATTGQGIFGEDSINLRLVHCLISICTALPICIAITTSMSSCNYLLVYLDC